MQVYVFGTELDGFKFDREQLERITGDKKRVFIFKNFYGNFTQKEIDSMSNHFCENPCVHVLHDHK